jgi:hypothetical protein
MSILTFRCLLERAVHLQGAGCHQEAELRVKLRGFREAFKTARPIKGVRFQELFAEAHLESLGCSGILSVATACSRCLASLCFFCERQKLGGDEIYRSTIWEILREFPYRYFIASSSF